MKLIYTGANGNPALFAKGVDTQRGNGYAYAGEELIPHDEKIGKQLIAQGVAKVVDEPKPEPKKPTKFKNEPAI